MSGLKMILAGIDGSEGASRCARWAAELARLTGASLELVHVRALAADNLEGHGEFGAAAADDLFASAERAIDGIVPAGRHVRVGQPVDEIVARSNEVNADLVVLGTLGLRSLEGVLLGSVSHGVLERSTRPVTIVP